MNLSLKVALTSAFILLLLLPAIRNKNYPGHWIGIPILALFVGSLVALVASVLHLIWAY